MLDNSDIRKTAFKPKILHYWTSVWKVPDTTSCFVRMQINELSFVAVVSPPGVAPHCLDPGTVRGVTVEKFCGEKWEESMQAHKSIRDMSKPAESKWKLTTVIQESNFNQQYNRNTAQDFK